MAQNRAKAKEGRGRKCSQQGSGDGAERVSRHEAVLVLVVVLVLVEVVVHVWGCAIAIHWHCICPRWHNFCHCSSEKKPRGWRGVRRGGSSSTGGKWRPLPVWLAQTRLSCIKGQ